MTPRKLSLASLALLTALAPLSCVWHVSAENSFTALAQLLVVQRQSLPMQSGAPYHDESSCICHGATLTTAVVCPSDNTLQSLDQWLAAAVTEANAAQAATWQHDGARVAPPACARSARETCALFSTRQL